MQRRIGAAAVMALAAGLFGCSKASDNVEIFVADLAGSNEVPAVSTSATGSCGLQVEGNRVLFSVSTVGLGNVVGAHIHIGPSGVNGPIRVVFIPFPGSTASLLTTPIATPDAVLTSGSFGPAEISGGLTFDQLLAEMRSGNTYCNVHTVANRGGEIRGQFRRVSTD
jgi:hypothetical protein